MNFIVIFGFACLFVCVSGITTGDDCDAGNGCSIEGCEYGCGALISDSGECYTFCADENGYELENTGRGHSATRSRSVGTLETGKINASLHNTTLPQLASIINQTSTMKTRYNETQLNATINHNFNNTTLIELINSTGLELVK